MKKKGHSSLLVLLAFGLAWFVGCNAGEPVPVAPDPGSVTPTPAKTPTPKPSVTLRPTARPTSFH